MAASNMVMSTMEALMKRMNWEEDQTKMTGIITAVVSPIQHSWTQWVQAY
jgi:hypothetical protein